MYKTLEPKDLIEGQFFYENDYGQSVLFIVTEAPRHVDNDTEYGWRWKGRAIHDGTIVNFFKSSKYSGYGPHISLEPEYMNVLPKEKEAE